MPGNTGRAMFAGLWLSSKAVLGSSTAGTVEAQTSVASNNRTNIQRVSFTGESSSPFANHSSGRQGCQAELDGILRNSSSREPGIRALKFMRALRPKALQLLLGTIFSGIRLPKKGQKKEEVKYLSGWKDIARYLGRGVRTVQRYERESGLPVRRLTGALRPSVVATKVELDAWMAASHASEDLRLSRSQLTYERATAGVTCGVRELIRLRGEMSELRGEMSEQRAQLEKSLARLCETIDCIRAEINISWHTRGGTLSLGHPWAPKDSEQTDWRSILDSSSAAFFEACDLRVDGGGSQ
jgi:hypothetical protein